MLALVFYAEEPKVSQKRVEEARIYFELHNRKVVLVPVSGSGFIFEAVQDCLNNKEVQIVIGFGDDSFLHEIAQVLALKDVALGIIPCSPDSLLAKEIGIPVEVSEACEVILSRNPTPLSLGEIEFKNSGEKRFFLQMVGVGLDAKILKEANISLQKLLGKGALALEFLRNIVFEEQDNFDIHSSEETYVGSTLIVSILRHYARTLCLTPENEPPGEDFHAFLFKSKKRKDLLLFLLNLARGKHLHMKEAELFHTEGIKVYRDDIPVQVDGAYQGLTPVEITYHKDALLVMMPRE
jgi:diacylglycerol kinase (ATP)